MGIPIISSIISGGAGEFLNQIGSFAKTVRQVVTGKPTPEQIVDLEKKALEIESAASQGQMAINLEEAKHKSIFVSGWRPYIGWICGSGLAYHFILNPLIMWIMATVASGVVPPPTLDIKDLIAILLAMLGLAGMRTREKEKGVTHRH